jgi:hypothetical protein
MRLSSAKLAKVAGVLMMLRWLMGSAPLCVAANGRVSIGLYLVDEEGTD